MDSLEAELRFTKEDLQATIEELETSDVDLHSVNEELYTVNAEYQKKIKELTELTHDMDNLLSSTDAQTIFLDEQLDALSDGLGTGSEFTVRLPACHEGPVSSLPEATPTASAEHQRVVLVQDEDDAREMLAMLLRSQGLRMLLQVIREVLSSKATPSAAALANTSTAGDQSE